MLYTHIWSYDPLPAPTPSITGPALTLTLNLTLTLSGVPFCGDRDPLTVPPMVNPLMYTHIWSSDHALYPYMVM